MLNKKNVLITGANGALGRAAATQALEYGADIVLVDLADRCQVENFEMHKYLQLDLTDKEAVISAASALGKIDVVFNIAGGFDMGTPVHNTPDSQWDFLFNLNVLTLRNIVSAIVPKMLVQGSGSIVNVGAIGALVGGAEMGSYCASKSVVMRLTESLSAELKHKGINVNAVLPSVIDTPANRSSMPDSDPSQWVAPKDLANVMCFLGSDAARAVHGALVPVAGLS
jgi:NAD(P)-dependent dehydrogenase (short-subunit alcohol dehydrogenase family)